MENISVISKPIIDLEKTGEQIKRLRTLNGFSVHDIQNIFGFEYPQAIYAWEQGKSVPTIDNLLILATIFNVAVEEIIITHIVEIELASSVQIAACKNCKTPKQQKAAFVKIA